MELAWRSIGVHDVPRIPPFRTVRASIRSGQEGRETARKGKGDATAMQEAQAAQGAMLPGPDPALQQLDRFVGTWNVKGRTLGSDTDNS